MEFLTCMRLNSTFIPIVILPVIIHSGHHSFRAYLTPKPTQGFQTLRKPLAKSS